MIYADPYLNPVLEGRPYTGTDGTQYPHNFPKSEIEELTVVKEMPKPKGSAFNVTGFIIDKNYRQVWQKEFKSDDQMDKEAMNRWKSQMDELDTHMNRQMEEHILNQHQGVTADEFTQVIYDRKRALRLRKPKTGEE